MTKLKRKKKQRWSISVEIITTDRTFTNSIEVTAHDVFDDDDTKDSLFEGAGVPDDMGPEDLVGMTFKIKRLS